MKRPFTDEQRISSFFQKVEFTPEGCWLWSAMRYGNGYGGFAVRENGRTRTAYAHRYSYEAFVGAVPLGLQLDHLCRNRRCVNPDHLEPVTCAENLRRGMGPEVTRARFARVTHCPQGHPYSAENTYLKNKGRFVARRCRICSRAQDRARRSRAKVA